MLNTSLFNFVPFLTISSQILNYVVIDVVVRLLREIENVRIIFLHLLGRTRALKKSNLEIRPIIIEIF